MDTDARGFPLGDLRVSDAERDQAVSELSGAFQAGRITAEEFDRRSTQALSARTGRELTATVADLPLDRGPVDDAPADNATPRRGDSYFVPRLTFAASFTSICFASVAVSSASQPGVGWTGALAPVAVSVLCLILVIVLRVHARRAARLPAAHPRRAKGSTIAGQRPSGGEISGTRRSNGSFRIIGFGFNRGDLPQ
jgi:hypothetical protein